MIDDDSGVLGDTVESREATKHSVFYSGLGITGVANYMESSHVSMVR